MEVDGENESSEEAAELDQATQVESRSTDALTFCGLLFRTLCQIPGIVAKRSKVRTIAFEVVSIRLG